MRQIIKHEKTNLTKAISMKYLFLSSLLFWLAIFVSCKSEYTLVTIQGNKMSISLNTRTGQWESIFERDKVYQEFTSISSDTVILSNPASYFQQPLLLNKVNKNNKRVGIWITSNDRMFEISNYTRGFQHGKCITYLGDNESIESNYKRGKLNGWYVRKLGKYTFLRRYYKNGIIKKAQIVNPKW
jgi:hypothetical protein